MKDNDQKKALGESEIQARLDALNGSVGNRLVITIVLIVILVGFGVSAAIIHNNGDEFPIAWVVSFLVTFAVTIVFFLLTSRANKKVKAFVSENITRGLLGEVFEVAEYKHDAHIGADLIRGSGLTGEWDKCSGSDLVRGKYKGRHIMFSNIKLEREETSKNSDGDTTTNYVTVFKGPWIFIEHNRRLDAMLRLREKPPVFSAVMKSDIETENTAFNGRFQILTTDGHTAFLVLTPHFMEFITSADEKARGLTNMCFDGKQTCIAIHNNSDAFKASTGELDTLRAKQRNDIRYITDILDEIMQNDYLFGGENTSAELSDFAFVTSASNGYSQIEGELNDEKKAGIFRGLNPIGLFLLAVYIISSVYALAMLPYGIVLSTDVYDPSALSVSTPVYIIVMTIFFLIFSAPLLLLRLRGLKTGFLGKFLILRTATPGIVGTIILLLIHWTFIVLNING